MLPGVIPACRRGANKNVSSERSSSLAPPNSLKTQRPALACAGRAGLRIESSTTELRWRSPNLATGFSTRYSLRLDQVTLERQSLQRHRNSLELFALCERDVGDGAAILQRRCDADSSEAGVPSQGLLHRCPKGHLRLGHRRLLALCGGVILAFCNRLGLDDLTGVVVYDHLEELDIFHRVNGELQFAFLHLELGGNRLAVTGAGRQTTLEGHPSAHDGFCQRTVATFLFLGRESSPPAHCSQGQNRNTPRHRLHVMPPI